MDDTAIWKKSEKDGEAFGVLYRQCAPRLRIFLRHLLINEHTAEYVMQNTFTETCRRPRGYDPGRRSLRAYLFGVARKQAVEWWRKQHPDRSSRSMIQRRAAPKNRRWLRMR